MDKMASKNFTVAELACKCCGVYGMQTQFILNLQKLRDLYQRPIIPTSAFRCPKHNKEVRGEKHSYHMQGLAIDIHVVSESERYQLVGCAFEIGFTGIRIDGAFVHLDMRPGVPVLGLYSALTKK